MLQSQTYLSCQEAATLLGVNDSRIRQMLLAGEIHGQKLGKTVWAIPSSEVERIIRHRTEREFHKR